MQAEDRKCEIERLPTMIAELRKEADDAQEAVNKHEHAWEQRMAACGLAGLGLAAYKTWRLRYDAALELIKKLVHLKGILKANRKQLREPQQKESGDDDHFRALLKSCSVLEDAGLTGSRNFLQSITKLRHLLDRYYDITAQCEDKRKRIEAYEANTATLASMLSDDLAGIPAIEVASILSNQLEKEMQLASKIVGLNGIADGILISLAELEEGRSEIQWRTELADHPQQKREQERLALNNREGELSPDLDIAIELFHHAKTAVDGFEDASAKLAEAAQKQQDAAADMADAIRTYVRAAMGDALMREALEGYRSTNEPQMMTDASIHLRMLTGGRYSRLEYDEEKNALCAVDPKEQRLSVEKLSAGTVDQVYLALRLAGVLASVRSGRVLPFVADDLFINLDDEKAAYCFGLLSEIARKTQIICLSHHEHLIEIAMMVIPGLNVQRLP